MVGYSRVEFNGRDASISALVARAATRCDRPEDGNLFADLIK